MSKLNTGELAAVARLHGIRRAMERFQCDRAAVRRALAEIAPPATPEAVHAFVWATGSVDAAARRFGLSVAEVCRLCERWSRRLTASEMFFHVRRSQVWDR
jgi:hypothetical protein